jgi:hypothetical protein
MTIIIHNNKYDKNKTPNIINFKKSLPWIFGLLDQGALLALALP